MRTSRKESTEKMLKFLKAAQDKYTGGSTLPISSLIHEHHVGAGAGAAMLDLGLTEKRGRSLVWVAGNPTEATASRIKSKLAKTTEHYKNLKEPQKAPVTLEKTDRAVRIGNKSINGERKPKSNYKLSLFWGMIKIEQHG